MSEHYLLIKADSVCARTGRTLRPITSALRLLTINIWPLWKRTPCRLRIKPEDLVAIYAGGHILATAEIASTGPWSKAIASIYPLQLDNQPEVLLFLRNVQVENPFVEVKPLLGELTFVRPGPKWGVCFMGGVRALNRADFETLTTAHKEAKGATA